MQEKAKDLNIYLVYLSPYPLDLNPIEQIWRSIKKVISLTFVENLSNMKEAITNAWNNFIQKMSHAKGWIKKVFRRETILYRLMRITIIEGKR